MTHAHAQHAADARREAQDEANARRLPITLWLDRMGWATTPHQAGDIDRPGFVAIFLTDPLPRTPTPTILVSPPDHVGRTHSTTENTTMATTHTADSTRIYTLTQQQAETIQAVLQDVIEGMGDYDPTCMAEVADALAAFVAE